MAVAAASDATMCSVEVHQQNGGNNWEICSPVRFRMPEYLLLISFDVTYFLFCSCLLPAATDSVYFQNLLVNPGQNLLVNPGPVIRRHHCIVRYCFRFPKDPERRKAWVIALWRENSEPCNNTDCVEITLKRPVSLILAKLFAQRMMLFPRFLTFHDTCRRLELNLAVIMSGIRCINSKELLLSVWSSPVFFLECSRIITNLSLSVSKFLLF